MIDDPKSEDKQPPSQTHSQDPASAPRIKIGSQRDDSADPSPAAGSPQQTAQAATVPDSPVAENPVTTETSSAESASAAPVADETALAPPVADETASALPEPARSTVPGAPQRTMTDELRQEIDDALGGMSLDQLLEEPSGAGKSSVAEISLDERCTAVVIKTDRESVFFNLGGQHEGLASLKQFDEVPAPGARLQVVPTRFLTDDNLYEVVVPGASVEVQDWSDLSEGVIVTAKITGHNKGGLECEVNRIRGFIPISQVALFRIDDLEPYVDQTLQCVVTEVNPERRNLVLSHRAVLEREREEAREKLLAELEVGQTREGIVRRVQDFGAFVDIGGVDGLVHVSQLSWDRIGHPSEVVEEGQTINVRIEKIDPATGKIGLSYRELLEHPWQDADTKYPLGAVLEGTVTKVMQFGAFVRVAPGIEGLVHISELAHHRVQRVGSVVQEGKTVTVKVLSVDPTAQKMSLSMKAVSVQPDGPTAEDPLDDGDPADRVMDVKSTDESLKGGLNRGSGGDQFGLKW